MDQSLFISYSRRNKVLVYQLVELLRTKTRHSVWIDLQLIGGDDWWNEIVNNIETSTCFVVMASPDYLRSIFCVTELRYASSLNKPLLPLLIEQCELPPNLRRVQFIDAKTNNFLEILLHIEQALSAIKDKTIQGDYLSLKSTADRPPIPEMETAPLLENLSLLDNDALSQIMRYERVTQNIARARETVEEATNCINKQQYHSALTLYLQSLRLRNDPQIQFEIEKLKEFITINDELTVLETLAQDMMMQGSSRAALSQLAQALNLALKLNLQPNISSFIIELLRRDDWLETASVDENTNLVNKAFSGGTKDYIECRVESLAQIFIRVSFRVAAEGAIRSSEQVGNLLDTYKLALALANSGVSSQHLDDISQKITEFLHNSLSIYTERVRALISYGDYTHAITTIDDFNNIHTKIVQSIPNIERTFRKDPFSEWHLLSERVKRLDVLTQQTSDLVIQIQTAYNNIERSDDFVAANELRSKFEAVGGKQLEVIWKNLNELYLHAQQVNRQRVVEYLYNAETALNVTKSIEIRSTLLKQIQQSVERSSLKIDDPTELELLKRFSALVSNYDRRII